MADNMPTIFHTLSETQLYQYQPMLASPGGNSEFGNTHGSLTAKDFESSIKICGRVYTYIRLSKYFGQNGDALYKKAVILKQLMPYFCETFVEKPTIMS